MVKEEHYHNLIRIINILFYLVKGGALFDLEPMLQDVSGLEKMVSSEMTMEYMSFPYKSHYKIPHYVSLLFHQFIKTMKEIIINIDGLYNKHLIQFNEPFNQYVYGFKIFDGLFRCNDGKTVNYKYFIQLFFNLETMNIFYAFRNGSGFHESIKLDSAFTNEIIGCIDIINESMRNFKSFKIVKPFDPIDNYINENLSIFEAKGWFLIKSKYENPIDGRCDEVLSIQRK